MIHAVLIAIALSVSAPAAAQLPSPLPEVAVISRIIDRVSQKHGGAVMAKLGLEGLTKRFGNVLAVNNLSLEIRDKEFMVLVGPSGCGKTTTLRLIAGLEQPDSGTIYIDDKRMNEVEVGRRGVQMIFPNYALWPHMKVMHEKEYTNFTFALKIRKWLNKDIKNRVEDISRRIGIDSQLFPRKPGELSEGQKQKVAIGRAIVIPPRVFLMDDPMTNIDPPSRIRLREEILKVHQQLQTTTIYVTHNMADAMAMADRIAMMKEGRILQVDTPEELYYHPRDHFIADFIRSYDSSMAWRNRIS
jgi:multiple sugar transport system ATP-binding protein